MASAIDSSIYQPISVVPAVDTEGKLRFFCPRRQLDISGETAATVRQILALCNGFRTVDAIAATLPLEPSVVRQIIAELDALGVVCDSRRQYLHFHEISSNPQVYYRPVTPEELQQHKESRPGAVKTGQVYDAPADTDSVLYRLQQVRRSCRSFDSSRQLTARQIAGLCDCAYSLQRHATPSGGALYPLQLLCILRRDQADLPAGYYEYDALHGRLIRFCDTPDEEQLKYCFGDDSLAFQSPLQVVICADLHRQGFKYFNHGYRLTLMEAGQAAQNMVLYCAEQGLASCELGGILDEALALELDVKDAGLSPLLAVAVGYPSDEKLMNYPEFLAHLAEEYVGEGKVVHSFGVHPFDARTPFFGAWARFGTEGKHTAGATGSSYFSAACKSIVEAYERHRSGCPRVDFTGSDDGSAAFLSPDVLAPLSPQQRQDRHLLPYEKGTVIHWTRDMSGQYLLPTDYVFYGTGRKDKLFYGSSSGVAAYTDYENARKRALAELMERDAVMRSWYERKAPGHVDPARFTPHVANRVAYWQQQGRTVHVLQPYSPWLPVYLVVITGAEYPCFVSGSAAATDSHEEALHKALQEAEYSLTLALQLPHRSCPGLYEVHHPIDHGTYYYFPENAAKLQWLWSDESYAPCPPLPADFAALSEAAEAVYVDLSEGPEAYIKVVRAVSRKLIPLSFGYRNDYYLHPQVQALHLSEENAALPHYYA